mgnify:CR=1 FL=1
MITLLWCCQMLPNLTMKIVFFFHLMFEFTINKNVCLFYVGRLLWYHNKSILFISLHVTGQGNFFGVLHSMQVMVSLVDNKNLSLG